MAATAILLNNAASHGNVLQIQGDKISSQEAPQVAIPPQHGIYYPIMSRLPVDSHDHKETPLDMSSPYLIPHPDHTLPGILPHDSATNVTYTLARLPKIDPSSLALWTALHGLQYQPSISLPLSIHGCQATNPQSQCPFATSSSTATPPHLLALLRTHFNFSSLPLPALPAESSPPIRFYGVIFRSVITPRTPPPLPIANPPQSPLYLADKLAHEEAVASGGLLAYIYGTPDPVTGANIATCVWTDRAAAKRASGLEAHRVAVGLARETYDWFEVGRYAVVWGQEGTLRIEGWDDEDW